MLEQFEGAGRVFAASLQGTNDYLNDWLRTYGGNKWKVGQVPKDADAYLRISLSFKGLKSKLQEKFANGGGLDGFDKVFDINIADCKLKLANPYLANRPVITYLLACWEDLRQFVALFPAAPPAVAVGQGTGGVATAATTPPSRRPAAPADPFAPLLLNYTVGELTALLTALGLLAPNGQATPAASSGAWVGVFYALQETRRIIDNKAGAGRAFCKVFGANVSGRALQNGLGRRGGEAEQVKDSALKHLKG